VLEAQVSGSGYEPYDVFLDWSDAGKQSLEASCSCPRFGDIGLCKHVYATILAADNQRLTPTGLRGEFEIYSADDEHFPDDDGSYDDGEDDDYEPAYEMRPPRVNPAKAASPSGRMGWKKQLAAIQTSRASSTSHDHDYRRARELDKPRQAWFVFTVQECVAAGSLVLHFYQRELKKNGEFSQLKALSADRSELIRFNDAEDRDVLDRCLGLIPEDQYGYYGYGSMSYRQFSACRLSPSMCGLLLPAICARGRLLIAPPFDYRGAPVGDDTRPIGWDDGPAWAFRLHFELDEQKKNWQITGRLHRGQEEADISRPAMVLANGLMLLDDRLARVDWSEGEAWAQMLRKNGPIQVPRAQQDEMLAQFWQLPSTPAVEMPDELRWEQATAPPEPRITIRPPERTYSRGDLNAWVTFQYQGQSVPADSDVINFVDRAARRVVCRDLAAERRLLTDAHNLGFKPPKYNYYGEKCDLSLPSKHLARVVPALIAAGWQVEAEGKLIRKPGEFKLSVSSGVDWFDLEARCDFDGQSVGLPRLLEALQRGQQFVTLDDGSQGMLPETWLAKFAPLAGLGETQGDALRFRPSQTMFLDALLAAQPEAKIDAQFNRARTRLREFTGVTPREQPAGFIGQLREYQQLGLGWLRFLQDFGFGGCLADDMGLGKTIQVLALLEERRTRRMKSGQARAPSLVVAPKSLVHNWIEEAGRFTPKLRVVDYTGLGRNDRLDDLRQADLVVTTYATMRIDILKLKEIRFDYAILDEAQAIKNSGSQAAKACRLLQADYRLGMTGTPVENHLGELWSIFEFLNPGMLGRSEAFKSFSAGGHDTPGESLTLLAKALRPFLLRRTKEQVLTELPEKTEQTLYCELDKPQRKLYNELRDHYRLALTKRIEVEGLKKSKIQVLEALLRLRQAACHPGLLDKKQTKATSAKLETLLEQLGEVLAEGHKALVFSQFTSLLDIVRKRLDDEKIQYAYLDGQTRARKEVVQRFQTDDACRLFLISLKAGGLGLNLTAADYVFILDPWWNPAVEAQAVDRAHRLGQTQRVFAYRLIARDTVEEKILELQGQKRQLAEAIVSADGSLISQLTADDLRLLLS
jgi:superfamily II DNA or RNA helicase